MSSLSYKNIKLDSQTIKYAALVLAILYLIFRRSLLVMGLLWFFAVRLIIFAIGIYQILYGDKTTRLLVILLLVVGIYTHTYIPSNITKEDFQTEIDDPDDPEYKAAVEAEEKADKEKQHKKDMVQETAIDIKAPTKRSAKAKPRRARAPKNYRDDFSVLHDKMHEFTKLESN
jgi:hypothetical protein